MRLITSDIPLGSLPFPSMLESGRESRWPRRSLTSRASLPEKHPSCECPSKRQHSIFPPDCAGTENFSISCSSIFKQMDWQLTVRIAAISVLHGFAAHSLSSSPNSRPSKALVPIPFLYCFIYSHNAPTHPTAHHASKARVKRKSRNDAFKLFCRCSTMPSRHSFFLNALCIFLEENKSYDCTRNCSYQIFNSRNSHQTHLQAILCFSSVCAVYTVNQFFILQRILLDSAHTVKNPQKHPLCSSAQ